MLRNLRLVKIEWGYFANLLAFVVLLALLSSSASAQIWFDVGSSYTNESGNTIPCNVTLNTNGLFDNYGTIAGIQVNGGQLNNYEGGTITNAVQDGGTFNNGGLINEMTYFAGAYTGKYDGVEGTIGTLTVAGNLDTSDEWGFIENLRFSDNCLGTLVITSLGSDMQGASEPVDTDWVSSLSFTGILAQSIDLTFGNILLDLTDAGTFEGDWNSFLAGKGNTFSIAGLFGTDEIVGMESLNTFEVNWQSESFKILDNGTFAEGWSFSNTGLGFMYGDSDDPVVPEPGTLLILGLGLTGAGLAVRRRK